MVKAKDYEYCINSITNLCPGLENIPISKYKISRVREVDYYLDPNATIERERYPDFLALTMIQTKGLCSYGGQTVLISNIPEIRYGGTYQCYYAYQELQCDDEEKEKSSSKVQKQNLPTLCKKQCYEYFNSLVTFLNNNDYCPFEFQEEYVQPDDVFQQRLQYTDKMRDFCDNAEDSEDCFILDSERNNCGLFFSFQFIKEIKKEERNRALRSVEKMFINNNSTTTSINSLDSGSQQSFPLSLATSDSNITALNAMNGSCPNIPMILNDANNSNTALNSPVLNMYRMNRHNKNKSSSVVNFNIYAPPALKSQSMGRNFRRKNYGSSSNVSGNQDKNNKKKKVMTSSEAQQLYPRSSSNLDENNSVSSSGCLPYSTSNGSYSSVNLCKQSDSHNPILDKKSKRKTSLSQLPYTNGLGSPSNSKTSQIQDIDSMSYDISNMKPPSNVNSMDSPVTTDDSHSSNDRSNKENNHSNSEGILHDLKEQKNEISRTKYSKRSASLHASSVKDLRFDSVKIHQMQHHILKQQQQLLQQQQQQQPQRHQQQFQSPPPPLQPQRQQQFQSPPPPQQPQRQQQQQFQSPPPQMFYIPQQYNPQTSFSPPSIFNPQVLSSSQPLPYSLPPKIALPTMSNPPTMTPLPQQFSPPSSFVPSQTIIPTQQMAPALPIRNKSMQSRSSSVKVLHHKNSIPQMTRKYSLSALEASSTPLSKKSKEKMELRLKSLDYMDTESSTSITTYGSKMYINNRSSDSSNLTNISGLVNHSRMNNKDITSPELGHGNEEEESETNSYYTEISSDVRTEDSMTTMIPTVVDSVPPVVDTVAPTLVDTMINSPHLSEVKKEFKTQSVVETPPSILKKANLHSNSNKEREKNKNNTPTAATAIAITPQSILKPLKKRDRLSLTMVELNRMKKRKM
ncbi:hypothetical protein PIROE2DRAFT_60720 [Piromyces sp. E2]|nr:hypothetical protein PIROE2DRAFT_60720 [Piromyces sp. E2]|eukprot:OUM64339.1 hypothetical protein PIROE2DRAFT_60720 [Piromyces sp. E2]